MHRVTVRTQNSGLLIGDSIEIADSSLRRAWGLLGRASLPDGGGLWIKPSSGVHTFGMRFAIDVVGLDRENRVVRVWSALKPWRVTAVSLKVRSVLELPAGAADKLGLHPGEAVFVTPARESL